MEHIICIFINMKTEHLTQPCNVEKLNTVNTLSYHLYKYKHMYYVFCSDSPNKLEQT